MAGCRAGAAHAPRDSWSGERRVGARTISPRGLAPSMGRARGRPEPGSRRPSLAEPGSARSAAAGRAARAGVHPTGRANAAGRCATQASRKPPGSRRSRAGKLPVMPRVALAAPMLPCRVEHRLRERNRPGGSRRALEERAGWRDGRLGCGGGVSRAKVRRAGRPTGRQRQVSRRSWRRATHASAPPKTFRRSQAPANPETTSPTAINSDTGSSIR